MDIWSDPFYIYWRTTMKRYVFSTIVLLVILTACATPTQILPTMIPSPTQTRMPTATQTQKPHGEFNIQSESIREKLEQKPQAGKYPVYGVVRFAGQPIINYTDVSPQFWVRDEDTGKSFETEVIYDPLYGEYLYLFPTGTYGISAIVVLGENYPTPGDYTSFTHVTVEGSQPALYKDLALTRIIHLTSPFDNTEPWDQGFERVKYWDTPLLESKTVLFSWDPIPEAIAYQLTITEIQLNPEKNLPWKNIQTHFDDRLTDTSLEIELPSSPEDHFYSVWLHALDQTGNYVGSMMIKLTRGYGWDVRFRVP
jgi:hypothetical protein